MDFVSTDTPVDLTNCDREPIHIPGAIQPYGVLFALEPTTLEILQTTESVGSLLGVEAPDILGRRIGEVLGRHCEEQLRTTLAIHAETSFDRMNVLVSGALQSFDTVTHRSGGAIVLELEPSLAGGDLSIDTMNTLMRATVRRLEQADSMVELAQGVAAEMRELTGFDRIWVYRFHPDWHGEIIGESKREDIETWFGMHYPASDIPVQARELFLRNWVRVIPDIDFSPSPLVPALNPLNGNPLDLGGSLLRSVSPIHVQYLQNMGVTASLVISLVDRGKLWGLISGHHYSGTKRVSYPDRALCEFLAQALSLQIGSADRLDARVYDLDVRARQSRLIERMGLQNSTPEQSLTGEVTLASALSATGAVIVRGGEILGVGSVPTDEQIEALLRWLRKMKDSIYETSALSAAFPAARAYEAIASGIIAVPLSRDRRDFLVWFRGEQRQTVRWAGDPRKPVTIAPDGSRRLHPRGSFELWEEEVRGKSTPWRPIELEAALDIRRALLDLQIRRAEEIGRLNEELMVTNAQLEESATELEIQAQELVEQREEREGLLERERFARNESERANRAKADFLAVMSHELRTPLNAIGGYAQLMALGVRGPVTEEQTSDLERIQVNQRHLLGLINNILNFTKLEAGQIQFVVKSIPLAPLLNGIDALIGPQMLAKSLRFVVRECDDAIAVRADEEKLRQIVLNLLTNALKFTSDGGEVAISCAGDGDRVRISVTDNGRGIEAAALDSIFEPFVQIDRHITPVHEQGVGLGLAISRELARGMNGDLHAASKAGVGSTFTLTLPAAS